jgi:hypothetical protein
MKRIIIENQNDIDELDNELSKYQDNSDLTIIYENNESEDNDLSVQIYYILIKNRNIARFNLLRLDIEINPILIAQIYEQFKIKQLELPRANIKDLEDICFYLKEELPIIDPNVICTPSEVKKLEQIKQKIAQ